MADSKNVDELMKLNQIVTAKGNEWKEKCRRWKEKANKIAGQLDNNTAYMLYLIDTYGDGGKLEIPGDFRKKYVDPHVMKVERDKERNVYVLTYDKIGSLQQEEESET